MRAETGYTLVPFFLDLVQYMMGKHPNLWNFVLQYFVKNSSFWKAWEARVGLERCALIVRVCWYKQICSRIIFCRMTN